MSDKFELTRTVALWEFRRFFKWKDQLKGILISLVCAAVGYTIVGVVMRDEPEAARVAVLLADTYPYDTERQQQAAQLAENAGLTQDAARLLRRVLVGIDYQEYTTCP